MNLYQFSVGAPQNAHLFAEQNGIYSQTAYWSRFRSLFRTKGITGTPL